jgi:SAM-dependent methyltransferase
MPERERPLSHADHLQRQFGPRADAYLRSAVHAQGPDLEYARMLLRGHLGTGASGATGPPGAVGPAGEPQAQRSAQCEALDVGCGAGHMAFLLATAGARVTAVDPSPAMLSTVAQGARTRALPPIATRTANAESLPFDAGSFHLAAARYSAHHWRDLAAGLREVHRVLQSAGHLLVIDVQAPQDALLDTHLQAIELLRDPSHVRDRSATEWDALLAQAGFELLERQCWPVRLAFDAWLERMRTPPERGRVIRCMQRDAPTEVQQGLAIEPDGSFSIDTVLLWARRHS